MFRSPHQDPELVWLEPAALRLGRCPVCGTSVLVGDEFVRRDRGVVHLECARFRLRRLVTLRSRS